MAKKKYEIDLEYLCREGEGSDDPDEADKLETFVYDTIVKELEEDEAKKIVIESFPPFAVPEVENCQEVLILDVRPVD